MPEEDILIITDVLKGVVVKVHAINEPKLVILSCQVEEEFMRVWMDNSKLKEQTKKKSACP